jgi:hypothetical protein
MITLKAEEGTELHLKKRIKAKRIRHNGEATSYKRIRAK